MKKNSKNFCFDGEYFCRIFEIESSWGGVLAVMRWPDGEPSCPSPSCHGRQHAYISSRQHWRCKRCGREFSAKTGTVFEHSPLTLAKWFGTIWILLDSEKVSSYDVASRMCVTQKTALFVLRRLRAALRVAAMHEDRKWCHDGMRKEAAEGGSSEVDRGRQNRQFAAWRYNLSCLAAGLLLGERYVESEYVMTLRRVSCVSLSEMQACLASEKSIRTKQRLSA